MVLVHYCTSLSEVKHWNLSGKSVCHGSYILCGSFVFNLYLISLCFVKKNRQRL